MAFGLGLIAQEQRPASGGFRHAVETLAEGVVAVLGAGDLEIRGESLVHQEERLPAGIQGLIEAGGKEAGLEACGAEEGLLGKGDALDGEEFLGVDGLVGGQEVGLEMGVFLKLFEADDGEGGGSEAVLPGILGGAELARGGAGAGGAGGVGAIGGELFGGDGFAGAGHAVALLFREVARGGADWAVGRSQVARKKGAIPMERVGLKKVAWAGRQQKPGLAE